VFGTVTLAYSLLGVDTAVTIISGTGVNLIGTAAAPIDPLLGPLADHGGPTMTHALLPGSPAIDAGDPVTEAGVGEVPLYDQREAPFPRVAGGRIDMGAFEFQTLGDMDFNGNLDFDDLDDFVLGLMDASAYEALHGVSPSTNGDMDRNSVFDFDDISSFAERLGSDPLRAAAGAASLSTYQSLTVEPVVSSRILIERKKWENSRDGLDDEARGESLAVMGEQLGRHVAGVPRSRVGLLCAKRAPCFREATRATPRPLDPNQLEALWAGDLPWLP
jgi:hypothetical protein